MHTIFSESRIGGIRRSSSSGTPSSPSTGASSPCSPPLRRPRRLRSSPRTGASGPQGSNTRPSRRMPARGPRPSPESKVTSRITGRKPISRALPTPTQEDVPVPRMAVIDMGSNSFRLVVFSYEPGGVWSLEDEIREAVRVSAGMGDERVLREEPMERALHTAAVYASFCRASGVDEVPAAATSAIRDARNRDDLLESIERETGLEVRVISGYEEAWYGSLAIANTTALADGFGIDVGGGSVQLLEVSDRRLKNADSLPLGAVRVSEAFLPDEEAGSKE